MSDYLDTLNGLLPEGMRFEWVPAEPEPLPEGLVDQAALISGMSRAYVAEALGAVVRAFREHDERVAAAHRRAWSGPNRLERQILRAYKLSAQQIGTAPRSAFSPAYRQRQRNRVKRRRR